MYYYTVILIHPATIIIAVSYNNIISKFNTIVLVATVHRRECLYNCTMPVHQYLFEVQSTSVYV